MTGARYPARVASPGMAYGTLRYDRGNHGQEGDPATGVVGALVVAAAQLRALQARSQGLGSDILAFQIEMLQDDGLVLDLLRAAESGGNPAQAIRQVFDEQIAGY